MANPSLSELLLREHHLIDEGLAPFVRDTPPTSADREPLARAIALLRHHIYVEEDLLFPPLREAGLMAPVLVMLREHAQLWQTLDAVAAGLGSENGEGPAFADCRQLFHQLQHHNLKEERIHYPPADELLSGPVAERVATALESSELPEGWVCTMLRPRGG